MLKELFNVNDSFFSILIENIITYYGKEGNHPFYVFRPGHRLLSGKSEAIFWGGIRYLWSQSEWSSLAAKRSFWIVSSENNRVYPHSHAGFQIFTGLLYPGWFLSERKRTGVFPNLPIL